LQQEAQLYFNLYLASISGNKKEKAYEYNLDNMRLNVKHHTAKSLEVSNNYYIAGQLSLKLGEV